MNMLSNSMTRSIQNEPDEDGGRTQIFNGLVPCEAEITAITFGSQR